MEWLYIVGAKKKAAIQWIIYFLIREAWYPLAIAWPSLSYIFIMTEGKIRNREPGNS